MSPKVIIEPAEREALTVRLALIGDKIIRIQNDLVTAEHRAFLPVQEHVLEFAESEQERNEYQEFCREEAKEILGSINHPFTGINYPDGFRSPYLEALRRKRDNEVGDLTAYKETPTDRWRFIVNPLRRRLARLRATSPDFYSEAMSRAKEKSAQLRIQEAAVLDHGIIPVTDWSNEQTRLTTMYAALGRYSFLKDAEVPKGGRPKARMPILVLPVHANWKVALCITRADSLRNAAVMCLFDAEIFLIKHGQDDSALKIKVNEQLGHRLRFDEALYGFRAAYSAARSAAELSLCVKAYVQLLRCFWADLKSAIPAD